MTAGNLAEIQTRKLQYASLQHNGYTKLHGKTEENPEIWDEAFTFSLIKNQSLNRKLLLPAKTQNPWPNNPPSPNVVMFVKE